LALEFIYKEE